MAASARKSWIQVNQVGLAFLRMPFAPQAALSSMHGTHPLHPIRFPALISVVIKSMGLTAAARCMYRTGVCHDRCTPCIQLDPIQQASLSHACTTHLDTAVLLEGTDMDELYVYDPKEHVWTFISPRGKKPAPRYLHTAVVVADAMLVFGGTQKTAGDVWSFNFKKMTWTRLSQVYTVKQHRHPVRAAKLAPRSSVLQLSAPHVMLFLGMAVHCLHDTATSCRLHQSPCSALQ